MRALAWVLLLLLAFTIPWEYSLDFGPPFGNVARTAVLAVLAATVLAGLRTLRLRTPGPLQWLVLALLVWFACSTFWTIDRAATLYQLRGYAQEFLIAWLVWELVESPAHVRDVIRAYVAGAWVLAAITAGTFLIAALPQQIRFVAPGQDPNDVARYLALAIPLAAWLVCTEPRRGARLLAATYLPFSLLAILLTASRSGFLVALVTFAGCDVLLIRAYKRGAVAGLFALPAILGLAWLAVPRQTLDRLATIPQELAAHDFNQRSDIWAAGWQAFARAPFLGSGAGTFTAAAGLAPIDTAHNTILALMVEGGVVALLIAAGILAVVVVCVLRARGQLRIALATVLIALLVSSFIATVHENRLTWLLLGLMSVSARLAVGDRSGVSRMLAGMGPEESAMDGGAPEARE